MSEKSNLSSKQHLSNKVKNMFSRQQKPQETKNSSSKVPKTISQQIPKQKNRQPSPQPLSQSQLLLEQQKQQALNRLCKLQQVSIQTQHKMSTLLLENIVSNVERDILKSNVQVAEESKEIGRFLIKKKEKEEVKQAINQDEILDREYRVLLDRKQNMLEKMREIEQQQLLIKKSSGSLFSSPNHKHNKMPELTQQNRQHWLKIRQFVKQHEENSVHMQQINLKKIAQQRQQQLELQQKYKKEKSLQKQQILQKRINDIENRHNQRTQHIKQSQVIIERLKNKKKLFQKMQDNWLKIQKNDIAKKQALMLQKYLQKRNVNMRELKQYEKIHDERFMQEEQNRKRKISQSKVSWMTASRYAKTRMSVDVLEQSRKYRAIQDQKITQIKDLIDKRKQFNTALKEKFRSKSRLDKNTLPKQDKVQQAKRGLKDMRSVSALELKSKGNEYMRTINSNIANLKMKFPSKFQHKAKAEQKVKQYKDYIKQMRMNRTTNNNQPTSNRQIDLIQSIMRKPNATTQQKFFQAQMVTHKMESGGSQKQLLSSISAKMEILKKLSYSTVHN